MNQEPSLEGSIAQSPYAGRSAQMFPHLTPLQIARLSAHGRKVAIQKGQILAEPGDHPPMYVVLSGSIEIIQPTLSGETLIGGSYTGKFFRRRGHLARHQLGSAHARARSR